MHDLDAGRGTHRVYIFIFILCFYVISFIKCEITFFTREVEEKCIQNTGGRKTGAIQSNTGNFDYYCYLPYKNVKHPAFQM